MKVFVIGGTRFIGLFAVQALLEDGHAVTIFNRSGPKTFEGTVEWKQGNRNDESVLRDAIRDVAPDVILDMIPMLESQAEILVR
ncbi:MAG TPA: NAD-dependent epimerase/dehydratase family protein, partial [bacterium]|nr:NAD-dependent epimerase/dehydratase family protein [bacterium]